MNEKLIKENLVWFALVIIVVAVCGYGLFKFGNTVISNKSDIDTKKEVLQTKEQELNKLQRARLEKEQKKKKHSDSGKIIYEVLGQQFTPEASFGIMFENILSNITNSGVRIRSIDYNYSPQDDKILMTNIEGYNACQLSFVAVGKYSQFQNFFKNLAKEKYLSSIEEIYLEPYDNDKTILIARFKIRLYTKSIYK